MNRDIVRQSITALVKSGMDQDALIGVLRQVDALYDRLAAVEHERDSLQGQYDEALQRLGEFGDLFDEACAPGDSPLDRAREVRKTLTLFATTGSRPKWMGAPGDSQ